MLGRFVKASAFYLLSNAMNEVINTSFTAEKSSPYFETDSHTIVSFPDALCFSSCILGIFKLLVGSSILC
jgi:hypothetical protein